MFVEVESVRSMHGDSRVWLVGHLEKYMLRLNSKSKQNLESIWEAANITSLFKHPIVGYDEH